MGESDVAVIREDLREVKKALAELTASVADLRVQVAGRRRIFYARLPVVAGLNVTGRWGDEQRLRSP